MIPGSGRPPGEGIGTHSSILGFPSGSDSKESVCNVRPGFNPWVGKIPWRRAWQPTPVFLPGEFPRTEEPGGLGPQGRKELDMTEMTEHA